MTVSLSKSFCESVLDDIRLDIKPRFCPHLLLTWYPICPPGWKELFVFLDGDRKTGFAFGVGDTIYVYAETDEVFKAFQQDPSWQRSWIGWSRFERIGLI